MRSFYHFVFLLSLCVWQCETLQPASPGKVRALYNSLDQRSIAQHLAFYELYPNTPEGNQALQHAWMLLAGNSVGVELELHSAEFLSTVVNAIVALINKRPNEPIAELSDQELAVIERLSRTLPHHQLKGHSAVREQDVLSLPPEQVDLARGLFLAQLGSDEMQKIRTYEASLDLMALQIRARMPKNATPQTKIRAINDFIFTDMGFRFPPRSLYAKDIDLYTFLPSVLDCRRGVCLGVSILYICLAQRLDLPLEMVTPPGHIYVRYRDGQGEINIETTARGIHLDSEEYLGIDTRSLQQRTITEVIGLAHFNQASVYWGQEKYAEALASYKKAKPYLPDDKLVMELMAYAYLLTDEEELGRRLLEQVKDHLPEYAVSGDFMAADYLNGKVDKEGIKAIFLSVDESRESIITKKKKLENVVEKYPQFRAGLFNLATAWLQLHRQGEALAALEQFHDLDQSEATAEYYLTMLYAERKHYNLAWEHFHTLEKILYSRDHNSKLLREIRRELAFESPE